MNPGRRNDLGSPTGISHPQRQRNTRCGDDENDDDMRRAIEESKRQTDEDERKRKSGAGEDDDVARAIKLSKEEEELRQSRLEDQNANSLFDEGWDLSVPQPQPVYQQQQQVDFWGNPIDNSAELQQQQSTGYLQNVYSQPTGLLPQQQTGFMPQPSSFMQLQSSSTNSFSNNPYAQATPQFSPQQTGFQPGPSAQSALSNNPYAAQQQQTEALQPMPTGSNNPFAQFGTSFNQQPSQQQRPTFSPSLSSLAEQPHPQPQQQYQSTLSPENSFSSSTPSFSTPQKQQSSHQNKLEFLLAQGNPMGQDTFGNTGETRVPAHYNRTGFVNSAGQGLRPSVTGVPNQQPNNPVFAGQQQPSGGVRLLTQSSTGPVAFAGQGFTQGSFGQYGGQNQQGQTGSLIDF
jgi:epsin